MRLFVLGGEDSRAVLVEILVRQLTAIFEDTLSKCEIGSLARGHPFLLLGGFLVRHRAKTARDLFGARR